MIPMRTSTVFKSRWMALLWAAGIVWFALDVAGSHSSAAKTINNQASSESTLTDADGQPVNNDDVNAVAEALGL